MGIVKKTSIEAYWSTDPCVSTPFFGKFMSRNRFQWILTNLHMAPEPDRVQDRPTDKLYKIRPFLDMISKNFLSYYIPNRELAIDEGGVPFRGRVSFRCYNPSKPAKFQMKIYQLCESHSGYVLSFDAYTGKTEDTDLVAFANTTKIAKVVIYLMEQAGAFGWCHHLYMDNYYTSPQLFAELLERETYAAGTVRSTRAGLPKGLGEMTKKQKTMEVKDVAWRRSVDGKMLALRFMDKRLVYFLSTIHAAFWVSNTRNFHGDLIWRPQVTEDYNHHMLGVDKCDQLMKYYEFIRRSVKWSRKMFLHFLNMAVLNARILYGKHQHNRDISHLEFRLQLAKELLTVGKAKIGGQNINVENEWAGINVALVEEGVTDKEHWPIAISTQKRKKAYRKCRNCIRQNIQTKNHTRFKCSSCLVPLHPDCFKEFHTVIRENNEPRSQDPHPDQTLNTTSSITLRLQDPQPDQTWDTTTSSNALSSFLDSD